MVKRRLRKRKRRPQKIRNNIENIKNVNFHNGRPQSLDQVQQIWDVMEFESINKPYNRRRLSPEYYPNQQETTTTYFEEIRNPYRALEEIDERVKSRTININNDAPDLKSVLKKSEGTLSLSEILQKQNLTLYDLLKGGTNAISALTQATNTNKITKISDTTENLLDYTETSTTSNTITKTTTTKYDSYKKIKDKLPITSAKLLKTKQTTEKNFAEKLPPKAIQIKLNDIFGFSDVLRKHSSNEDTNGPLKMVIDLDNMTDKTTTTPKYVQHKLKIKTAKEEILEFVNDEVNKENITDILESRNMTLEELIQLRERGSNQGRLLDIFRNNNNKKTKKDVINDETYVDNVRNLFESTSVITGRRPKNIEINADAYNTKTKTTTEVSKLKALTSEYTMTSFPVYKIEANNVQLPYWKSIYPASLQSTFEDGNKYDAISEDTNRSIKEDDLQGNSLTQDNTRVQANEAQFNSKIVDTNVLHEEDIDFDSKLNSVVDKLNVELEERLINHDNEDEELFNWPRGVKSALFASLAIIAASLLIFLSILIIFKLTQKTKRKLCYHKNLMTENRIKTPILNDKPKRTIRTIMCDTLGRKKINYWRSMHNVPDTIWDNNRIPFQ